MTSKTLNMKTMADRDWLRQSFMIAHGTQNTDRGNPSAEDVNIRARFFSPAEFKFSDTTVGGNMVINPLPQFTKLADPRVQGLNKNSEGLGRYYSEAIDDNKRIITMTFGVASFNSLSTFYKGFYDHTAATMARTGRAPGIFYKAGQLIGFVAGFIAPWLVLYSIGSAFIRSALSQPSYKYYFFKQAMPAYWNAVSGMANDIATKTGLITRKLGMPSQTEGDVRQEALTDQDMKEINKSVYDVIDSYDEATGDGNGINVYAVATKHARMQRAAFKALEEYYIARSLPSDFSATTSDESTEMLRIVSNAVSAPGIRKPKVPFAQYLENWSSGNAPGSVSPSNIEDESTVSLNTGTSAPAAPAAADANSPQPPQGTKDLLTEKSVGQLSDDDKTSWYDFLLAELNDGAQYVTFRVENTGDASESFSNSVGEPEILGKINSASGAARNTRFTAADGNIVGGIAGKLVGGVIGAAKDVVMGAADSLGVSGIAALGGNAFADIPKTWLQSTSNLPSMSYRIKLVSPYGNRYSKFVNIWLPLTMLLVGALPLSTGPYSYTSPFLCQLYDRGRAQTRLGIIDSISVSRGGMNLAFNRIGEPMAVDVSFTVVELSNVLHMPVAKEFNPIGDLKFSSIFDNEGLYNDYIATLSSLSLTEQIYVGERIKIGITKYMKNLDTYFSVPHAINWGADLGPMKLFSGFFPGIQSR